MSRSPTCPVAVNKEDGVPWPADLRGGPRETASMTVHVAETEASATATSSCRLQPCSCGRQANSHHGRGTGPSRPERIPEARCGRQTLGVPAAGAARSACRSLHGAFSSHLTPMRIEFFLRQPGLSGPRGTYACLTSIGYMHGSARPTVGTKDAGCRISYHTNFWGLTRVLGFPSPCRRNKRRPHAHDKAGETDTAVRTELEALPQNRKHCLTVISSRLSCRELCLPGHLYGR